MDWSRVPGWRRPVSGSGRPNLTSEDDERARVTSSIAEAVIDIIGDSSGMPFGAILAAVREEWGSVRVAKLRFVIGLLVRRRQIVRGEAGYMVIDTDEDETDD